MGTVSIRFNLVLEGKLRSLGDDLLLYKTTIIDDYKK
jgi:hypothetical protein